MEYLCVQKLMPRISLLWTDRAIPIYPQKFLAGGGYKYVYKVYLDILKTE